MARVVTFLGVTQLTGTCRTHSTKFDQQPAAALLHGRGFCLGGQLMFTRNSPPEPSTPSARPNGPALATVPQHRTGPTDSGDKSIIGNDLRIIGQGLRIISRGILQIDGEI